jgi:hypothetical protein
MASEKHSRLHSIQARSSVFPPKPYCALSARFPRFSSILPRGINAKAGIEIYFEREISSLRAKAVDTANFAAVVTPS